MATLRQKRAARAVLDAVTSDNPPSAGQVLKSVGYGTGLQNQPKRVLDSQGFQEALAEYGLTEELITTSLVSDIKKKPTRRLGELRLGAELLGTLKGNGGGNTYNVLNVFEGDQRARIARRVLARSAGVEESPHRLHDRNQPKVRTELAP